MQIQGIGNTAATSSQSTTATTGESDLQGTFLQLMIKQMQNQDPFSPMDNQQFIQQLATFANLEELQSINSRVGESLKLTGVLAGLTDSMNTNVMQSMNASMMGLVGKQVYVPGNEATMAHDPDGDEPLPVRLLLRSTAKGTVHAMVKDDEGNVVRDLGNIDVAVGFTDIEWDGRDDTGHDLDAGRYTISVEDGHGNDVTSSLFTAGLVEAVQFDTDFTRVRVGGKTYLPGQIVEVGIPGGA